MRQIEQGKGPESDTNTLPIALMKSKMATNNPKFYKGAIKLYKNVFPPGRCAISCKVMNDPRSRNARAPNEATYLNVIVLCQPFLSQKEVFAWKLYHNKNPNSMMPMLTFEWNILATPKTMSRRPTRGSPRIKGQNPNQHEKRYTIPPSLQTSHNNNETENENEQESGCDAHESNW